MFERKNPSLQKGIDAYKTSSTGELEGAAVGTVRSAVLEGGQYFDSLIASLRDENITNEELVTLKSSIDDQVFADIVDTLQNPRGLARITGANKETAHEQYRRLDELTYHIVNLLFARGELGGRYESEEPDTEKFREFKATIQNTLETNRESFEDMIMNGIRVCREYVQQYPDGKMTFRPGVGEYETAPQTNIEMPKSVTKPMGEVIQVIHAMHAGQSHIRPLQNIIDDWMFQEYAIRGSGSAVFMGEYSRNYTFLPDNCEIIIEALLRNDKITLDKSELENLKTVFRENWKHRRETNRLPLTDWVRRKQGEE